MIDGRKDRRNYAKRGRGVETPTKLSDESALVDNTVNLPVATYNRIALGVECDKITEESLCKDVISTAFIAELTPMAEAVRDGDAETVTL